MLLEGVPVSLIKGCSIRSFLCDQLMIEADYVEKRITTVFLDGRVVDSLDEAILRDGSILALSAAMPGLVGATLRRNGFYSAMRASISQDNSLSVQTAVSSSRGIVLVKLFNLLVAELGPVLLRHAIPPSFSTERND
ncbi:MAG TPA: hypothetical protein DD435_06490 [Cyanobacteria bacterium UBA8530]|nr:hypothetical protein [Cyanobacteria bacterium UBA8530]